MKISKKTSIIPAVSVAVIMMCLLTARSVYFISERDKVDHARTLMDPGSNTPKIKPSVKIADYRLEVNPYGTVTAGCRATGTIKSI